jgi:hypothetical protein
MMAMLMYFLPLLVIIKLLGIKTMEQATLVTQQIITTNANGCKLDIYATDLDGDGDGRYTFCLS